MKLWLDENFIFGGYTNLLQNRWLFFIRH